MILELCFGGQIGIHKCASHAGNSPLLTMHPLTKNQLSHDLDLPPLILCPNDDHVVPHLFSHHIFDTTYYLKSHQEARGYLSIQNAVTFY